MIFNDRRPLEKMHLNFPRYVLTNVRYHPTHKYFDHHYRPKGIHRSAGDTAKPSVLIRNWELKCRHGLSSIITIPTIRPRGTILWQSNNSQFTHPPTRVVVKQIARIFISGCVLAFISWVGISPISPSCMTSTIHWRSSVWPGIKRNGKFMCHDLLNGQRTNDLFGKYQSMIIIIIIVIRRIMGMLQLSWATHNSIQ